MADAINSKTFQFELVSPERILVSEEASMVVVPGEAGDFGVLANHAPLLSSIRPGVVSVTSPDGTVQKIFVAGGFADVSGAICSVLAEEAVNLNDLDRNAIEAQVKDLQDDMTFVKDDATKTSHIQKQIDIAQAKLQALGSAA